MHKREKRRVDVVATVVEQSYQTYVVLQQLCTNVAVVGANQLTRHLCCRGTDIDEEKADVGEGK